MDIGSQHPFYGPCFLPYVNFLHFLACPVLVAGLCLERTPHRTSMRIFEFPVCPPDRLWRDYESGHFLRLVWVSY